MKRIVSFLLVITMIPLMLSGVSLTVNAETSGLYLYDFMDEDHIYISRYLGDESEVIVPDTIDGLQVVRIGEYAFQNCDSITSVVLPNTITSFDIYAFDNCDNLQEINIPEGFTKIVTGTFNRCTNLKSITLPGSVEVIEEYAFNNCTALASIELSEKLTTIGECAFYGCTNLLDVVVPNGVTAIRDSAFAGCTSLRNVVLPSGLDSLSMAVFAGCESLTRIDIPNGITDLSEALFSGCKNLVEVNLPETLRYTGYYTFYNCISLKEIELPQSLVEIGVEAFNNCESLERITLPESVSTIELDAFCRCSSLNEIIINNADCNIVNGGAIPEHTVIMGYNNSTAKTFANDYGRTFISIDSETIGIKSINVSPISIIEGTNGYIATGYDWETEYEYYHYSPENNMEYTITWTDGTVTTGSGTGVEYNGEYYWFDTVTEQSYLNKWAVGNTYTMKATLMGVTVEVPVTIEKSPVKSVSIKPISLIEGTSGYITTDYDWETETEYEYFCYQPEYSIEYTVVWSDGSASTGSGNTVEYNEEYFWFETETKQSYLNKWEAGNSYLMSVWFMGVGVEVPVTIENSPIEEIVFEPITLVERVHGYQSFDYNDETGESDLEYFRYAPENNIKYTIHWSNGTTTEGTESGFVHNGEYVFFDFNTNQSYWNQWEVGNSYLMTAFLMGVSIEVPITIESSPINSIEMIKAPNKCTYEQDEFMNPEGAILRVKYTDGTYEDLTLCLYDYLAGSYVYIERFATEIPVRLKTDNVEINNKYYISFMGYDVPVDVTVDSRDLQIIVIQNKGYDLEITAVYNGGQQKTFKALSFRDGLGDGVDNLQMWGGNLVTDNGIFFAQMWKNTETGEFFIKWRVGEKYVTSNTLDNCPWWDLQQRISDVAWAFQPLDTEEFNGEITAENIDELITVAISVTDLRYDGGANISGTLFRADSVKIAFYETFGVIPDLSLSSNYNAKDRTYKANLYGFGGRGYKVPFVVEFLEDEIKVKVEWYVENTQYITFDKNLYITEYSTEQNEYMLGDVNGDGDINIMDATEIQRHIAQLSTIPEDRLSCADANKDGQVNIMDATQIQRFIAQLIPSL